jgi:hypothetical protein
MWVGGIGKLGDFEYAKNVASNSSHDIRTVSICKDDTSLSSLAGREQCISWRWK